MSKDTVSILGILGSLLTAAIVAAAGSDGGVTISGLPVFAVCVVLAFVVQWLVFVPSYIFQTEKYFDLTGSLTYISLTVFVWFAVPETGERALLIGILVVLWAMRLGSFLFRRVLRSGEDRRFRSIKPDFLQFLMTWTLQGLWVSLTYAAGLAAMSSAAASELAVLSIAGFLLWIVGFGIEIVADSQKTRFRGEAGNESAFITTGLWRYSRHPNYFGEILLWCGIAVLALPALSGWQYVTLVSPLFVILLLTKISGVRMLEARANRQWGEDPAYQAYKASTPVLFPFFFRG